MNAPEDVFFLQPTEAAAFRPDTMGKADLYRSERLFVGLNGLEPGQSHAPHVHADADKTYVVLAGTARISVAEKAMTAVTGAVVVAPAGVPHGIENAGPDRLTVLVTMAPPPGPPR